VRRPALAAALSVCVLAGCGEDDGDGKGRALTVPAGQAVDVVGREYSFDPTKVVVEGPGPVRLTLSNRGALAHNLKVLQGGRDLGGTPTFPGGRSESGTVRLEPGKYQLVCTVDDHADLGMTASLEVRSP
jgi:plastocyanin